MKKLLPRYNFADISVFKKKSNGDYVNLTDYVVSDDNDAFQFKSDSDYIIMMCSYLYKNGKNYVCDITLRELCNLAGAKNKLIAQFQDTTNEEYYDDLLAVLCAKRIIEYRAGKVVRSETENDITYCFHRHGREFDGKKHKHIYPLVFEKKFYKA